MCDRLSVTHFPMHISYIRLCTICAFITRVWSSSHPLYTKPLCMSPGVELQCFLFMFFEEAVRHNYDNMLLTSMLGEPLLPSPLLLTLRSLLEFAADNAHVSMYHKAHVSGW